MREIKFRAWWSNIGEMEYFDTVAFLNFEDGTLIYQKHPEEETYTDEISDGFELMQYTGLKDKNGKEIYEGDVLHAKGFWGIYIVWDKENARFGILNTDWVVSQGHITKMPIFELSSVYEIVGNIYENPELLEGTA